MVWIQATYVEAPKGFWECYVSRNTASLDTWRKNDSEGRPIGPGGRFSGTKAGSVGKEDDTQAMKLWGICPDVFQIFLGLVTPLFLSFSPV